MDLGSISRIVDILTGCRIVHYRFSRDRMVHGVDQWTRPILHRSEPEHRRKSSLAESTEYREEVGTSWEINTFDFHIVDIVSLDFQT